MAKPAKILSIYLFSLFWMALQGAVLPKDETSHYTAGVVEFEPASYSNPSLNSKNQLAHNLKGYLDIITSQDAVETDIIVFPELTLNGNSEASFVPDPAVNSIAPCDVKTIETGEEYHEFLIQLSCQARNVSKYIVVNIAEKAYCEPVTIDPRPCAKNGLNIFNTNVVFDRNGVVISRYRKVNLWGEPRNVTYVPSLGYFDTDFGVRFGHFVCFDLLFYTPAQEMVDKYGIQDFLFPTKWFSQLPFLTGVQIQSAWSYANDVNFLGAGASHPARGTTGTGIYAGRRGHLRAVMSQGSGQRKIFVARLEKKIPKQRRLGREINYEKKIRKVETKTSDVNDIYLKRDDLEDYETVSVDLINGQSLETKLCQRNEEQKTKFCCHFELHWRELNASAIFESDGTKKSYYNYRLGVFNGLRAEVAPTSNFLRNCAIFACTGEDLSKCGQVFAKKPEVEIIFEHLVIEATFPNATEVLLMPNSLVEEDLLPVPIEDFSWSINDQGISSQVRFELKNPVSNLLAFSAYGNYYDSENVIDEQYSCEDEIEAVSLQCENNRGDDGAGSIVASLMLLLGSSILSSLS